MVSRDMGVLSTGIDSLDRRLNGGFNAGSLVTVLTSPETPSHSILHQLMQERPTVYITTLRSRAAIETDLEYVAGDDLAVSIAEVGAAVRVETRGLSRLTDSDIYSIETTDRRQVLDEVYDAIGDVDGPCNVIVDPMNPLERSDSRAAYQRLLQKTARHLRDQGALGLFHCISSDDPPPLRDTTKTVADVVWGLEVTDSGRDDLAFKTHVPKNRGGEPVLEKLTLLLDHEQIYVDDSRAI